MLLKILESWPQPPPTGLGITGILLQWVGQNLCTGVNMCRLWPAAWTHKPHRWINTSNNQHLLVSTSSAKYSQSLVEKEETSQKVSAGPQSLGSGIPTAVCCPCICCLNWATSSSVQQSCRKTAARLRRRGLSDREKRSMHCTMAALEISERDEGEMRFIKVVMADRTVSSLWLDRQFVTKLIPLLCKMMSWHSGSILRLHSPPGRNTQHNTTDYQWWSEEMQTLSPQFMEKDAYPAQIPQSSHSPQWACPRRGPSLEVPSGAPCSLGHMQSWPGWPALAP